MYIKVTTTRTKSKTYQYVKLVKALWESSGNTEQVIATLGTVEDIIKSREGIIHGLHKLKETPPHKTTRQKRRSAPAARGRRHGPGTHRTKRRLDITGGRAKRNPQRSTKSRGYKYAI